MPATRSVALLRGINVGGNNKIPMADLKALCGDLGWKDVATYIQSGNVVFSASGTPAKQEVALQAAIQKSFGFTISVLARTAADWQSFIETNPFSKAAKTEAKMLMLALAQKPFNKTAEAALSEKATSGEKLQQVGNALWIHFPGGVGKSKLTPAVLDRLAGSPVTLRNWNTVMAISDLLTTA